MMYYQHIIKASMVLVIMVALGSITQQPIQAAPTPLYEYIVVWSLNTEADMAGYILEKSATKEGLGGWAIVNDNIAKNIETLKLTLDTPSQCFRLSAFDKSKNVSGVSQAMCGQYIFDALKPASPIIINLDVKPFEEPTVIPNVSSPKLTVSGKNMLLSWDPQNAETEVWMANGSQVSTLTATVPANSTNVAVNGTVSGWHCFMMRHKIGSKVGAWASANPADPTDVNFCTAIP